MVEGGKGRVWLADSSFVVVVLDNLALELVGSLVLAALDHERL
jgi:hypothetical protein